MVNFFHFNTVQNQTWKKKKRMTSILFFVLVIYLKPSSLKYAQQKMYLDKNLMIRFT